MAFTKICSLDDLWEGDMEMRPLGKVPVLLIYPEGGEIRAFQGICPHQQVPLWEGTFEGGVLTCKAHEWSFDGNTGVGINPGGCTLAQYKVKVEGEDVFVDVEGVEPVYVAATGEAVSTDKKENAG